MAEKNTDQGGKGPAPSQWEYHVTLDQLPQPECDEGEVYECSQAGECFVHDACQGGLSRLEKLFREKGKKGWELVQTGYHHRELLCIWKKRKETTKTD